MFPSNGSISHEAQKTMGSSVQIPRTKLQLGAINGSLIRPNDRPISIEKALMTSGSNLSR
jgi:hypothetical protein